MADVKISELPALTSPDGAEELVVNDGGTTKKITIANATSAALPKAGGTMTGVIAAFESTGIDDNSTETAITIDANENVGIGVSDPTFSNSYKGLEVGGNTDSVIKISATATSGWAYNEYAINDVTKWVTGLRGTDDSYRIANGANLAADSKLMIDSSGNVVVGATAVGGVSSGTKTYITSTGNLYVASSGEEAAYFNRNSNNGSIVEFRKNNTTVGSIGTGASEIFIGSNDAYLWTSGNNNAFLPASTSVGGASNGLLDVGSSGRQFKDAYLSGGIHLGGTGAANKLDDYEEGTFTPYIGTWTGTAPTTTGGTFAGSYTKIGSLVTCQITVSALSLSGTTSGLFVIKGLPFTPSYADQSGSVGPIHRFNFTRNDHKGLQFIGTVGLAILSSTNNGGWDWEQNSTVMGSSYIRCSITYMTNL